MYAKGRGVPQDYVLSYMWFTVGKTLTLANLSLWPILTAKIPALLPRGIGIAKPSGHGVHGSQQGVLSEGGIIVESDGLAQRGFDPSEHRQHDRNGICCGLSGEPGGKQSL